MSHHHHHAQKFPPAILWAALGMIVLSIGLAVLGRVTGIGRVELPESTVAQSLELRFVDRADGALVATRAIGGAELVVYPPGSNGFVRGVLRGLARDRKLEQLGSQASFRLTRWTDGRLTIEDSATRRRVDLGAFGHTNQQVFVSLLSAGSGEVARAGP